MRFCDFLDALVERGEDELVFGYLLDVSVSLMAKDYVLEEILEMDVDVLAKEIRTPVSPYGWNTVWGKSVVCG